MITPGAACVAAIVLAMWVSAAFAQTVDVYAAGDIADCEERPPADSGAARTAELIPTGSTVLVLGDTSYPFATKSVLESCYDPTWGRLRATTLAVPGNHDYVDGRADDFRAYFETTAGGETYFSRQIGGWLVIGLDSQLAGESLEREYEWLQGLLSRHAGVRCALAFWHMPAFASGLIHNPSVKMRRFWALLEEQGVDLVLNGHEHFYEAFRPLDSRGKPDAAGMREFIVGTGGAQLYGFWKSRPGSRIRLVRHGVLRLALKDGAYAWQFIDTEGRVRDDGDAKCRS
jgi:predicted phosphodiesterase